jgi:hypothetical protein
MNTQSIIKTFIAAGLLLATISCKKENSLSTDDLNSQQELASSSTSLAIAASSSGSDSIYLVNICSRRSHKDSIAFSGLPTSALTYLSTNYAGYTSSKAFTIKDTSGTITDYVAVIVYNSKPVGVLFDATGAFVRVLEQREGRDLNGAGWHHGGCFDDRSGAKKDTIALSSLSTTVTSYIATNYPQDTLVRAFSNRDSSIVVLSMNNGLYATMFTSTGTFVKRIQLPAKNGRHASIELAALPQAAQTYLSTIYPNYVFKHAFKITANNAVTGYGVFLDSNATKYAVEFDAAGNFVKAATIH